MKHVAASITHLGSRMTRLRRVGVSYQSNAFCEWKKLSIVVSSSSTDTSALGMPNRCATPRTSSRGRQRFCRFFSSSYTRSDAGGSVIFIDGSLRAARSMALTSWRMVESPLMPLEFSMAKKQRSPSPNRAQGL